MEALLDPVVLFFALGVFAALMKSDLKVPGSFYQTLSIYLLLSIGIKGGIELSHNSFSQIVAPSAGTLLLGIVITLIAFTILLKLGKFDRTNAVAIATHYGSVSAVTFAVALSYLKNLNVAYESYSTVLLVMLEIPSIAVGIVLARVGGRTKGAAPLKLKAILHEVFFGKTILLLLGGMAIGLVTGYTHNVAINSFFLDLFKGFLCFFMLEMGIVSAGRIKDLKKVGAFLLGFGLIMPLISALLGVCIASLTGLSVGGSFILATMAASASYIAAPAAMKIALPEANPTLSLTASLGITFPFNVLVGIPLYYQLTQFLYPLLNG
jgi:uncharacterized protein